MSPDGQTIVTGAGDETLRFWNAFVKSKSLKVMANILKLLFQYFFNLSFYLESQYSTRYGILYTLTIPLSFSFTTTLVL